jgi:hypothetical protein
MGLPRPPGGPAPTHPPDSSRCQPTPKHPRPRQPEPHRSRRGPLQGLLQHKGLLPATEPAWEPPARDREIAARNRQLDHRLDQRQTKR